MILGIAIGGTRCRLGLGRIIDGRPVLTDRVAFATTGGWRAVVADLIREALGLLRRQDCDRPTAIGVTCGGPLDARTGRVLGPPNLPGWDDVPLSAMLGEALDAPSHLENDADAAALAEWRWGAGRGCRSLAFLTCGTGLGAGLILDGRLWRGASNRAGEIGHCRLSEEGPMGYGKAGSAEGWASGGGLGRAAGDRFADAAAVFAADATGDDEARRLVDGFARGLGRSLALISDLCDVERIIIGAIFARNEARLRPLVEAMWRAEALPGIDARCRIVTPAFAEDLSEVAALAVAPETA